MKRRDRGQFIGPLKSKHTESTDGYKSKHLLVHVTSTGAGRAIVEDGKLEARYCRHFDKNLVYFFVDRPGYQPSGSDEKSDQINRFPFVFVHELDANAPIFHAYPFDTGAALEGMFDEKADPYVFVEDYELSSSTYGVEHHISWAFDNQMDYFKGFVNAPKKDTLEPWQSVERSYFDIAQLSSPVHNRPDNRASAVEVAFGKSFSVHKNNTRAIFPKQLIENGKNSNVQMMKVLSERRISWQGYNWLPNSRPIDFFQEISSYLEEMLTARGRK